MSNGSQRGTSKQGDLLVGRTRWETLKEIRGRVLILRPSLFILLFTYILFIKGSCLSYLPR